MLKIEKIRAIAKNKIEFFVQYAKFLRLTTLIKAANYSAQFSFIKSAYRAILASRTLLKIGIL